jgi:hypothetical protein
MAKSLSNLIRLGSANTPLATPFGGTGLTISGNTGNFLISDGTKWTSAPFANTLPSQTANTGKYLTTDGLNIGWATVSALPTQSGNTGKYLTTDGANASWAVLSLDSVFSQANTALTTGQAAFNKANTGSLPTQTANTGKYLTTDGANTYWGTVSGGASITNDITTNYNYTIPMSNVVSGSWATAYIANTKLYFNPSTGTLYSTIFQALSDETVKNNIITISNGLSTVNALNGVEFTWKETGKSSAGVIAQELEQILPSLVTENDGIKSVNYLGIIGYLIEAVKELSSRVEKLESK